MENLAEIRIEDSTHPDLVIPITEEDLAMMNLKPRSHESFLAHTLHCQTCRMRYGVALRMQGPSRDMAFWSLGFNYCVNAVRHGELVVPLARDPANN